MYCPNCGARLSEGSRFCEECGAPVPEGFFEKSQGTESDAQVQSDSQAGQEPKSGGSSGRFKLPEDEKSRKILYAGAAVAVVLIALLAYFMFRTPSINLNKYVEVSFSGYENYGTARVTFDSAKFESDNEKKLEKRANKTLKNSVGFFDESLSEMLHSECVGGRLDVRSGLSNGDKVTYEWSCDDETAEKYFGVKLRYKDQTFTVSGLDPVGSFDPFEGLDVYFEGISPDGTAQIVESDSYPYSDLDYRLDRSKNLANGETVTIVMGSGSSSDFTEDCVQRYGMVPTAASKEYTVSGLDSYVTSLSEISGVGLAAMKTQAEDVYGANVAKRSDTGETFLGMDCLGGYLLTAKSDPSSGGTRNAYYLVYKASYLDEVSNDHGAYRDVNDVYWYIRYVDLVTGSDGQTIVDIMDYRSPFDTSDKVTFDSGVRDGFSNKKWTYNGFLSLEDLYKSVVTSNAEKFYHEDAVEDKSETKEIPETEPVTEETEEETESEEVAEGEDESESVGEEETAQEEETEEGEEIVETVAGTSETGTAAVEIFPDSSTRLLTSSEIAALSDDDLRLAINEVYARHGYIFKDQELRNHFLQFDWYEETLKSSDWTEDMFNDVEYENVKLMGSERDSRK